MAYSVDWVAKVITIPTSDLTLISGTRYSLDMQDFLIEIRRLESAFDEGLWAPQIVDHTDSKPDFAGVDYAGFDEVINGYTIQVSGVATRVDLLGSNNNIVDALIPTGVAIVPSNSAGLQRVQTGSGLSGEQDQRLIDIEEQQQYESYHYGVTLDPTSGNSGTGYPNGNRANPVDNLPDAVAICAARGFKRLYLIGTVTLDTGSDLTGFTIEGDSLVTTSVTVNSAALVSGCVIRDCNVQGTLDGDTLLERCVIGNLDYVEGNMISCALGPGVITLGGTTQANILDCWSNVAGTATPIIDCGGSGRDLGIRNYNGGVTLRNKTGAGDNISIDMNSGKVILEATCTAGDIVIRGTGTLTDNSAGANVIVDNFIQAGGLSDAQHDMLHEQWGIRGCHSSIPTIIRQTNNKPTRIEWGGLVIDIEQPDEGGDTTLTRQP